MGHHIQILMKDSFVNIFFGVSIGSKRGTNIRGDAQIAPIKAPRTAQTILGLQENQDRSDPTKTLTSRKTAHWEST